MALTHSLSSRCSWDGHWWPRRLDWDWAAVPGTLPGPASPLMWTVELRWLTLASAWPSSSFLRFRFGLGHRMPWNWGGPWISQDTLDKLTWSELPKQNTSHGRLSLWSLNIYNLPGLLCRWNYSLLSCVSAAGILLPSRDGFSQNLNTSFNQLNWTLNLMKWQGLSTLCL